MNAKRTRGTQAGQKSAQHDEDRRGGRRGAASDVESLEGGGRAKKRERAITAAAAEVFHRRGYADTSVQDVADAVGILKGSLYYYIDSKDDLLFRVLSEVHEDARSIVDEVDALDAGPLEKLYGYIRRHLEYNAENLAKMAVYYHDFELLEPERRKEIREQRALYERFVTGLIKEGQAEGEIDTSIDAKVASYFIFGALNWIYTWFDPAGRVPPDELGYLAAEMIVKGLREGRVDRRKLGRATRQTS